MKTQLPATYNVSLKTAIVAARMTQLAVGRRAGISETRLTRIVRGQVVPTPRERRALARVLATTVDVLFGAIEPAVQQVAS